jgi:hypothetical protein
MELPHATPITYDQVATVLADGTDMSMRLMDLLD